MKTKAQILKIEGAEYVDKHILKISFSDGTVQTIDFGPFLRASLHPEIRKFINAKKFRKFSIKDGELMWGDFDLVFPVRDLYENKIIRSKAPAHRKAG